MIWYEKYKVGMEVKVIKKVDSWNYGCGEIRWNKHMDKTINRVYEVVDIDEDCGCKLFTRKYIGYNFWYPLEYLAYFWPNGQQLVFDFMIEKG